MRNQWKAWLERGQKDLQIAKDMFEKKDYEHAAYMTQQALEKHAKAVWITGGGEPDDLKHDIVIHLVDEINEHIDKGELNSELLSTKREEIMGHVQEVMCKMRDRPATRIAFWSQSLSLENTNVPKGLQDEGDYAYKFMQDLRDRIGDTQIICRKAEAKATSYGTKPGSTEPSKLKTTAIIALIPCIELIVRTFPHNTYGRYPTYIESEKEISTTLYARQFCKLDKMVRETEKLCTFLSFIAGNLAKAGGS